MKKIIHRTSGLSAMILISTFLISTLYSHFFLDSQLVVLVKSLILFPGLVILIPCLMLTGGLGANIAGGMSEPRICIKRNRMKTIAVLGILVLIPSAFLLNDWAENGLFDTRFYALQVVEVIAGFTNLTLLSLNFKDGLRMAAEHKG